MPLNICRDREFTPRVPGNPCSLLGSGQRLSSNLEPRRVQLVKEMQHRRSALSTLASGSFQTRLSPQRSVPPLPPFETETSPPTSAFEATEDQTRRRLNVSALARDSNLENCTSAKRSGACAGLKVCPGYILVVDLLVKGLGVNFKLMNGDVCSLYALKCEETQAKS